MSTVCRQNQSSKSAAAGHPDQSLGLAKAIDVGRLKFVVGPETTPGCSMRDRNPLHFHCLHEPHMHLLGSSDGRRGNY